MPLETVGAVAPPAPRVHAVPAKFDIAHGVVTPWGDTPNKNVLTQAAAVGTGIALQAWQAQPGNAGLALPAGARLDTVYFDAELQATIVSYSDAAGNVWSLNAAFFTMPMPGWYNGNDDDYYEACMLNGFQAMPQPAYANNPYPESDGSPLDCYGQRLSTTTGGLTTLQRFGRMTMYHMCGLAMPIAEPVGGYDVYKYELKP